MSETAVDGDRPAHTTADIEPCARALVAAAFLQLSSQHVIPPPVYHPWIRVGRDYDGPTLMKMPEFEACEALLDELYPERFSEPLTSPHAEFSNAYLLHLLEVCVWRCANTRNFDADTAGVTDSIRELIDVLDSAEQEIAVVRAVSHVRTSDGQALLIDGIEIVPEQSRQDYDFLLSQCRRRIPASGGSFNRERPLVFAHPLAAISTIERAEAASDPLDVMSRASRKLARFLRLLRLLTGTTARFHFEGVCLSNGVWGPA